MNKNTEHEITNLDILKKLQKESGMNCDKKATPKKDEYAMLEEDYLSYAK